MIKKSRYFSVLMLVTIMVVGTLIPASQSAKQLMSNGFDKGPSFTSVIPTKKVTFVNFDDETLIDDYAYLAAVPTAAFNYEGNLISHPLLFFQEKMKIKDDIYRTLDAYTGIKYFMDDWEGYCNQLDQMTLINLEKNMVDNWKAREYVEISEEDPFSIASALALHDWSYSNNAVISVIDEEFEKNNDIISNELEWTLPPADVFKETIFTTKQTNSLNPVSQNFEIDDEYKFITADAWWDGIILGGKMIPTGDPDIQLHFKNGDKWMSAVASSDWNIFTEIGHELTQTYIYQPGDWRVMLTDFPTESESPRSNIGPITIQGNLLGIFRPTVTYNVDITMYPGVEINIPDIPTFGCKDAEFKLKWNNPNVNLGMTILGPSGEAVISIINESREKNIELTIERLGECLPGENYKVSVFSTTDNVGPLKFEIEYSWKQEVPKEKGCALDSAANGAILASTMNAPLLYVKPSNLPKISSDTLLKLGVKNLYIVDIGNHLSKKVYNDLKDMIKKVVVYDEYMELFEKIRESSNSNDVIFTTIDPWTTWLLGETKKDLKPSDETKNGLFLGPATYIAAHHGTPVLIIDNHPHLSAAAVWHNEFWRRFSDSRAVYKPSVAEMVLTGTRIYDFLEEYGFEKEGKETIITVADQYEIGISWDRIFPGVANSGRICGSPVDTSVWISRSMFYPALIFENPAMQGKVSLETGSSSSREGLRGLLKYPYLNTLVINQNSREKEFEYPVLCSFVTIKHRFNERASNYYKSKYQCADGLTPGESPTMEPIDEGVNKKYYGQDGMYFPDMTTSEVIPFYLEKAGYDAVYSTNLNKVTSNLNEGVLMWIHTSHGNQVRGGQTLFWDPENGYHQLPFIKKLTGAYKEPNPWRGYDWLLGSTEEPDTMSMDLYGFIPFTNHNSLLIPAMGMDWVLARKPFREFLVNRPLLGGFFDIFLNVDNLYDGVTGALSYSKEPTDWKTALEIEQLIENLHSTGFITCICQTSNTYFHLMIIRHGSVFQIQDPWPTSWYGAVWQQSVPRDIALGNTVGEAYTKGISHVGTLYLGGGENNEPQWWWDDAENVVYFGDPDLRLFVPENEYSSMNYWEKPKTLNYEKESIYQGHTPFGATKHPHEIEPETFIGKYLWLIIILALIIFLVIVLVLMGSSKKTKK